MDRYLGTSSVWKLDRLVRRPADFERFWALCERSSVILASATEPVDSSTELGLAVVRILVTFASLESATRGIRLQAKYEEMARSGAPPLKRGRRSFGYDWTTKTIVPDEADLIREGTRRLLAGEKLNSIMTDWNSRGLRGINGGAWVHTSLRRVMTNPVIAGFRRYRDEIVARGDWPAIISERDFERVLAAVGKPGRATRMPRLRYLLSPLLVCGKCRGRVSGSVHDGMRKYKCVPPPYACFGVSCRAEALDEWVAEQFFAYLDSDGLRDAVTTEVAALATTPTPRVVEVRDQLKQLADDYYRHEVISRPIYREAKQTLQARLDHERAALERQMRSPALARLAGRGKTLRRQWPKLSTDERRAKLLSAIDRITIRPGTRGRWTFDPARYDIAWRI